MTTKKETRPDRGPARQNKGAQQIELLEPTAYPSANDLLVGAIGLFETVLPDQILAYYLYGSHVRGVVTETSDLDLILVFRDRIQPESYKLFHQLRSHLRRLCNKLDINECDQQGLMRYGTPVLTRNTLCLYGKDIRSLLPPDPVGFRDWAMHMPYGPNGLLSSLRRQALYLYPLQPINPDHPYLGYDCRLIPGLDGAKVKSVKMLLSATMHLGIALIGARTGISCNNKAEFPELYRLHVGDDWSDFIDEVAHCCVQRWRGYLPQDQAGQDKLAGLCVRLLAFENHFLECFRLAALKDLEPQDPPQRLRLTPFELAGVVMMPVPELLALLGPEALIHEADEQWLEIANTNQVRAAAMLGRVLFPADREILDALTRCQNSPNPLLAALATRSLNSLHHTMESKS